MTDPAPQSPDQLTDLLRGGATAGHWTADPARSSISFAVKHFWGLITVRGTFDQFTGAGDVTPDGAVTGELTIDAASVNTKNKRRDDHLRSGDFFHAEEHPHLVVAITSAEATDPADLACHGTITAGGQARPLEFTAHVDGITADEVTLRSDITIDRTEHGMTWNPMGMTAKTATATALVRWVRS
jgi:polyisoprenoid-binding protein YceI